MRWILLAAAWLCLGLAVAGVFLPVLPTTPFLLLATACAVRGSPRLHARILAHPRLGPFLERWRRERSVPRSAKIQAYVLVVISFGVSIYVVEPRVLRILLGVMGVAVLVFLTRLRTARPDA